MKTREQAVAEKGAWDKPAKETMSKIKLNINGTFLGKTVGGNATKWTVADEAIHRGANYAEHNLEIVATLRQEQAMTMFAVLKNAYQEGFLHGFAHKFDDTNYEQNHNAVEKFSEEK